MYKLTKPKGHNTNVTLTNTTTKSSLIIGRITTAMLDTLTAEGYSFDTSKPDATKLTSEWNLKISDDAGKTLASRTMKLSKPKRDQSKNASPKSELLAKAHNTQVDAMDVLLGLASYK